MSQLRLDVRLRPEDRLRYNVMLMRQVVELAEDGWAGCCLPGDDVEKVHDRFFRYLPQMPKPKLDSERLKLRDEELQRLTILIDTSIKTLAEAGITNI